MVLGTLNNWGNLNLKDGDLKPLFLGKSVIRSSANSKVVSLVLKQVNTTP